MILLKFKKTDNFCFISHIDTLRHFQRIFRRAGIDVRFSNGFNPHMLIYFSSPLPLGLASRAEYVTVCTDMKAKDFLPLYNKNCPEGLMGIAAVDVDENPNLQFRVVAAQYDFFTPLEKKERYIASYVKKGESVTEDVTERVFEVGEHTAILASGAVNLRPERFATACCGATITEIVKTKQYILNGDKLADVDEFYHLNENALS